MDEPTDLREVLEDGRACRLIDEGIYSVLPDTSAKHHYDKRAAIYDIVVSTSLYNRVMWGTSPRDYVAFAHQAVASCDGRFLDAACGSMLFTAQTYVACDRTIIAFDQSLAMLRRARKRLRDLAGSFPKNILLLQADLNDLPFRTATFRTVLCLNALHQVENATALLPNIESLLTEGGELHLTSLVSSGRFLGDRYLRALHAIGEFVRPRSKFELRELLDRVLRQRVTYMTRGNMAYAWTATPGLDQVKS